MMKKGSIHSKVAMDMLFVQGGWTVWFLGIITIVHIIKAVVSLKTGSFHEDFYISTFVSGGIYMLIIGIISAFGMLPFYVKNGVTRKDYFKGGAISVVGIAGFIVLFSLLITGLEHAIIKFTDVPLNIENTVESMFAEDDDGILIASIMKMLVASPFVSLKSNWLLSITLACLNLVVSYLIGWMIGASYYRYHWVTGFGFIAIGVILMVLWDLLWGSSFKVPLVGWIETAKFNLPVYVSIICSLGIIALLLSIIRILTKKVTVKL